MKKRDFWKNAWFNIPVLLFFIAGLGVNFVLPYGEEIRALNSWRIEPYNTFFKFFTRLGEPMGYLLVIAAAFRFSGKKALIPAVFGLFTLPVMYFTKDVAGVNRPISFFEKAGERHTVVITPGVELNTGFTSFPSGHTMSAFGLFALVNAMLPEKRRRWGVACAVIAVGVGFSRIFLVQHFLADVLAGAFMGLMMSWGLWIIAERYTLHSKASEPLP